MLRPQIVALCAAIAAMPAAALAQGAISYYTPPKLAKQGTSTTPIAGPGTVIVKVLVKKDGTFQVQGVVHSSNAGDNKAALEIAATSKYHPATRGDCAHSKCTRETAFYDFSLKFNASGAEANGGTPELEQYRRMINAGNFSGAQSDLKTFIAAHPNDPTAELYLAVATTMLNQPDDAIAAYKLAGTIPAEYRITEAKAYADGAVSAIQAKAFDKAVALAKQAVEIAPTFANYDALGYAQLSAGDPKSSVESFERARDLGKSEKASDKQRALVATNLISAYLLAGDTDKAKAMAAEAKQLDPSTNTDPYFENYYASEGNQLEKADKVLDAVALYEKAAHDVPDAAAAFYAKAAFAYLRMKPSPDNVKALADAEKALAIDPNSSLGNFAKGLALANEGKSKDAMDYLKKADDQAKKASDPGLAQNIENVIKQLNGGK